MSVLFLLKKNYNYNYNNSTKISSGLLNSATFVAEYLEKYLNTKTYLEICVDGNEVDKYLHKYNPEYCILEAIWVTPAKLEELVGLYPKIKFIVRVHSNIPFLSQEGMALTWILKFNTIKNVQVAFNNGLTVEDFKAIGVHGIYLPNLYPGAHNQKKTLDSGLHMNILKYHLSPKTFTGTGQVVNIGCFGAIRPLKNQLLQAIAAIGFADSVGVVLNFHINSTRVEQQGETALKNIRAVFDGVQHKLIEHPWMEHEQFLELVKTMDLGMQVSLTESFNIITADFVAQNVPIIVSPDINWMPSICQTGPFNVAEIIKKMSKALMFTDLFTTLALTKLNEFNFSSLEFWAEHLHKDIIVSI